MFAWNFLWLKLYLYDTTFKVFIVRQIDKVECVVLKFDVEILFVLLLHDGAQKRFKYFGSNDNREIYIILLCNFCSDLL